MNSPDLIQIIIVILGFLITTVLCHNLTLLWKDVAPKQTRERIPVTDKPTITYR